MRAVQGGRKGRAAGVVAVVALGAVLTACSGSGASEPETLTFHGDVTLHGAKNVHGDLVRCVGVGAFADVKAGTKVRVTTPSGKQVAVGKVRYGLGTNTYQNQLDECTFRFRVAKVQHVASYLVRIGHLTPRAVTQAQVVLGRGSIQMDVTDSGAPATTPSGP